MPVFGVMRGRSSAASCSQSFSASGSLVKVLLQDQLRRDRVDRLVLYAFEARFRLHGSVALVDARHRQLEALLQAAREVLRLARHLVRLSLGGSRQADDQRGRLPFLDERLDIPELGNRRQRMRGAQLRLPYRNAN